MAAPPTGPSRPGAVDGGDVVVLCGTAAWDAPWLGSNHLARALARRVPVLYVDPPRPIRGAGDLGPVTVEEVEPGLYRTRPRALPGKDRTGVHLTTGLLVRRHLRYAVTALGRPVRGVISGLPRHDPFGVVGERTRVFRVTDDFVESTRFTGIPRRRVERAVDRLAARADVVVCSSPVLADQWARRGHRTELIPNGCDVERLSTALDTEPRPDLRSLPRPVVAYVGHLTERIDLELLDACRRRAGSLLVVGDRSGAVDPAWGATLLQSPGCHWTGHVHFDDLPEILAAADVGVLPYRSGAFNEASFPLKILEYLAAGLPVVSTDLPAARWLATDQVRIADPPSFADAVLDMAAQPPDRAAARVAFARDHSWDRRAEDLLALL